MSDEAPTPSPSERLRQHTFVVENLERRIRDSGGRPSGISYADDADDNSELQLVSTPDPGIVADLEDHANAISSSVDVLLRELRGSLHGMSDLTLESTECFAEAVGGACDGVDAVIKTTYAMLAKVEELDHSMKGVKQLYQQVKDIKRVVDLFETQLLIGPAT